MKKIQILSLAAAIGLLVGCASQDMNQTASVSLSQLPPAAQTTVRNEIGDQQVSSIKQTTKDGQTAYCVELDRKGMYPTHASIVVAADGSILKESRRLASERTKMTEPAGSENNGQANPSGITPSQSPTTTTSGGDVVQPGSPSQGISNPTQ